MKREQMGAYLKKCRNRIPPEAKGISSEKRRVPGLRREEVAELAGISHDWYTRLEQGRVKGVSKQVIEQISAALNLTPFETEYLFSLADDTNEFLTATETTDSLAENTLRREMLAALLPHPAYYVTGPWNVLAWNEAVDLVLPELFDDISQSNAMRMIFCNPSYQRRIKNWARSAHESLAVFRGDYGLTRQVKGFDELVSELKDTSNVFSDWWAKHEVTHRDPERKVIVDPKLGNLHFITQCYVSAKQPDLILVVFTGTPRTQQKIQTALDEIK